MQAANENFEPEIDLAKLPGVKAAEEFKPLDTMATLEHQAAVALAGSDFPWEAMRQQRPPYTKPLNHRADSYGVLVDFDGSYFDDWYTVVTHDGRRFDLALALPETFRTLRHDDQGRTLAPTEEGGNDPIDIPHSEVAQIALAPDRVLAHRVPSLSLRQRLYSNRIHRAQWLLPEEQADARPAGILAKQIKLMSRGGATIAQSVDAQVRNRPLRLVEGTLDWVLAPAVYTVDLDSRNQLGPSQVNRLLKQQGAHIRLRVQVGFTVRPTDNVAHQAVQLLSIEEIRPARRPVDWMQQYGSAETGLCAALYFTRQEK